MSMPTPTGRRETRDGQESVVFDRTFRAPIDDVWAAITESDRLARWIGTWTGEPASGSVTFRMNAEGDDVEDEVFTIHACDAPRRLVVSSRSGDTVWHLEVDLAEVDGVTTLTFSQSVPDAETATGVGPGWEWYLDRLVAAETGADVDALDFGDYHPAMGPYYLALFSDGTRAT